VLSPAQIEMFDIGLGKKGTDLTSSRSLSSGLCMCFPKIASLESLKVLQCTGLLTEASMFGLQLAGMQRVPCTGGVRNKKMKDPCAEDACRGVGDGRRQPALYPRRSILVCINTRSFSSFFLITFE
jgi:hypothetical protein